MGYEIGWTEIDKLAYKLYSEYMESLKRKNGYAADWWFKRHKEQPQYKRFYDMVERKYKI